MHNLLDATFNGMGASEMYRAQIFPELFPHQGEMLVHNWPVQDIEMYVIGMKLEEYFGIS